MTTIKSTAAILLTLLLAACPSSNDDAAPAASSAVPEVLRDTSGAQFEVVDGDLDDLRATLDAELPPPCDGAQATEFAFWLGETGLSMICLLDPDTGGPSELFCRPIACDTFEECTPGFSCIEGTCRCAGGICRTTDGQGRVDDDELIALCLADQPRSTMCPPELDALELYNSIGSACDEETGLCAVPAACR